MKILVIPDVHLKPQMFKQATALMHQGIADRAVCLMDIPDDWDKQYNVGLMKKLMMSYSVCKSISGNSLVLRESRFELSVALSGERL